MVFKSCCYFVGWDWSPFAGKMMLWQVFSNVFFVLMFACQLLLSCGSNNESANALTQTLKKWSLFGWHVSFRRCILYVFKWFRCHPIVSPWQSVGPMKRSETFPFDRKVSAESLSQNRKPFFTGHEVSWLQLCSGVSWPYTAGGPYQFKVGAHNSTRRGFDSLYNW